MQATIDATDFQFADDGNATHYGGVVTVTVGEQTKEVQCHGTDRDSYNCYDEIRKAITDLLGLPELDEFGSDDEICEAIQHKIDSQETFIVAVENGKLFTP